MYLDNHTNRLFALTSIHYLPPPARRVIALFIIRLPSNGTEMTERRGRVVSSPTSVPRDRGLKSEHRGLAILT
jgi:hypothetical protein